MTRCRGGGGIVGSVLGVFLLVIVCAVSAVHRMLLGVGRQGARYSGLGVEGS